MKRLFIIAFLLLTVSGLKAQESFLGLNRVPAFATLELHHYGLVDTGNTKDEKFKFFHYAIKGNSDIFIYFNSDDICTMLVWGYSDKGALTTSIEDLNKKYNNIGNYEWIDKNASFKIKLRVFQNSFALQYRRL